LKHQDLAILDIGQIQKEIFIWQKILQKECFPIVPKPVFWKNNPVSFRQAACHIKKIEF